MVIEFFKFWLRSVAQMITPSGACYNLRNGTQPKVKRFNSELIMEGLTSTLHFILFLSVSSLQ